MNTERLFSSAGNAAYERHVLRQLKQEPGEDVDSFVLRLRKQARHCGYGPEELEFAVRDQLLEKVTSLELRTKLFEKPNIQLAAAIEKARAWEKARRQASNIAEGEEGQSNVNMVKDRDSKKPSSGFGTQKCYACGKVGHFARDKVCPAWGKTGAKCGQKGHWAACCKSDTESKKGGRVKEGRERGGRRSSNVKRDSKSGSKQVNQVEYDSGDEPYAFPISFNGERACEDNVIMVKIDNITTSMLVDSGAQSTVLGERQFNNLGLMRCANEAIRREKLPIPTVDEVLEELNGSTVFSKLDMNMGFHQIELEEGSRNITTFSAGDSLFCYKRLSFGINSAPEQYKKIVRQTIAGSPGATNIADDIVVHGKTTEDHDRNLVALLNRL